MTNSLFILVQILLIINIVGRNSFFTKKEIVLFSCLIIAYVISTWKMDYFFFTIFRRMDLYFFILIYFLEIIFIYRKKHSLFPAAIFTITQNTVLAVIWTVIYDLPFLQDERKSVYFDSILVQSVLLISILGGLILFNKRFKFIQSFLAINKKYNFYSMVLMGLNTLLLLVRQIMIFNHNETDYFYLTIILTFFSVICIFIIWFINYNYKKRLEFNTFVEELRLLENQNNLFQEFKHDYNNILTGLNEYLHADDLKSARDYLDSVITYSSEVILPTYYFQIKEVPILAVQSILLSTVKRGKEANLDVILTIEEFPAEIKIDLIDFIRCLSILTNNALEHSTDKIYISLTGHGGSLQVIVKNTYADVSNVATLFKKNYSTKAGHPGIGLFIFQKILNSYTNTSYTVDKTDHWIAFSFVID